ncbi:hypothetical protein DHD80_16745 [Gramella sp. AN32]|nr:hypothetical protein [Gramella sp. AN32]
MLFASGLPLHLSLGDVRTALFSAVRGEVKYKNSAFWPRGQNGTGVIPLRLAPGIVDFKNFFYAQKNLSGHTRVQGSIASKLHCTPSRTWYWYWKK